MLQIKNDEISYIKSYIRKINNLTIGPLELQYTTYNLQAPINPPNESKYLTNSLDVDGSIDNANNRFLIPELHCENVSEQFCSNIENLIWEIEQDIRENIVFYSPINFQIIFSELDDNFESDTHLASTCICAYYCLKPENSDYKFSYPQALVKQFITNGQINYTDSDFVITLSQNENSYIMNANELAEKNEGYDLKLILYHEIIHGLGIKSEAISYPNYLASYNGVNPSDYTPFTGDNSYLFMMVEPTIYDHYIRNDNISNLSLSEEMVPMVEKFPEMRDRIGQLKEQNLIELTSIIREVVENNSTIVNGAWRAYSMVTQDGLYFKGNSFYIPLHVFDHTFETGVSMTHTKHYEDESIGDKVLLDWRIPNGKLLTDTSNLQMGPPKSLMGPEITDMLETIGWSTVNHLEQDNYLVQDSDNIFSLVKSSAYSSHSFSLPIISLLNSLLLLFFILWFKH